MVSIPKIVGAITCGFLLSLGLSHAEQADNAASAVDEMKPDQSDQRQGVQEAGEKQKSDEMKGGHLKGGKTIKGEVLRVEYGNYVVKGEDGKEVRLQTDQTTQMMGQIRKGDRIEAKMNDQNHALSIRETQ